jgi:4-amino-4-deoxy-L-arabinose transferase-like glycosyltransferase
MRDDGRALPGRVGLTRAAAVVEAHARLIAFVLIAAGVVLRAALAIESPRPEGYVWDFYHDGIRVLYTEGRLPVAADCWQCYHPPLFYLLGWPLYALGRSLAPVHDETLALRLVGLLPLAAGGVTIHYGYRLLMLLQPGRLQRLLGLSLLLVFPCLFISSYGVEADIVLTAILSAFIFYLTRYFAGPGEASIPDVVRLGVLAGLAAATKYNGLVALASVGILLGLQVLGNERRARAIRDGLLILGLCLLVGGWKYVDNVQRYGTPLHANGPAADGLSVTARFRQVGWYEFPTIRLIALAKLFPPDAPPGDLTDLPPYPSVITSLHALGWSDMSFFSVPSRHGHTPDPYPFKIVPRALVMTVIVLGFVPELLAIVGIAVTWRDERFRPLRVVTGLTLAAYVWWFLPQTGWALKTKYILFLLPPFVVYAMAGLMGLAARRPAVALAAGGLLAALVLITHAYLLWFAVA